MPRVLSNATGVDTLISSATVPMTEKLSFHCPPDGEGDTDARPSISDSESDPDQDLADGTLNGSVGGGEGKTTPQEDPSHQQSDQESDEKPGSQSNGGFTVRPTSERPGQPTSSPWKDLDISVVLSILTPLLSWAFGREYMKNIIVAIFLVYYLHQLIEGSCTRETRLALLTLSRMASILQSRGSCITRRVGDGLDLEYPHQKHQTSRSSNSQALNCGVTKCRTFASQPSPRS